MLLKGLDNLLKTGYYDIDLELNIKFNNLKSNENVIWTLFMLAGYLTPVNFTPLSKDMTLRIPNLEIKENLQSICIKWFKENI